MNCPHCGENITPGIEFAFVGQMMCPNCGEVISILDNTEREEDIECNETNSY